MNKSELIEALAQKINIPLREANAITNTVLDTMTEALAAGDSNVDAVGELLRWPIEAKRVC